MKNLAKTKCTVLPADDTLLTLQDYGILFHVGGQFSYSEEIPFLEKSTSGPEKPRYV